MELWKRLMCITLCALMLSGCGILNSPGSMDDPSSTNNESTVTQGSTPAVPVPSPDDDIVDIGYDQLPCSEEELYNQLFNLDNKIDIDIDMSPSELQKMQDDYEHYRSFGSKSPIYRMGHLTITITTATGSTTYRISEVGVRMKGNTSRTDFYNPDDGIYKYIHLKLDFQETFDDADYYGSSAKVWANDEQREARKDRTFATLEQLEMRWNKCYDQTYLKETYAYALYRSEGVLAPLTNLCSFDWSGVHMGVYCIVEPVDKIFIEKRLPEADQDGDLYKCGWPADFTNTHSIGIEDEDKGQFYTYDLKNNKKTSDHSALKNLISALNSGSMTKERLAELVDMDNFLSYAAVSYFLGNPDDLRNNYNNFYLYFKPSDSKAIIIPYDYDRCLGVTYEWNPTGNGVTQDNPFSEEIAAKDNNQGRSQQNPLFLYSVVRGGLYVKEFADVLRRVEQNKLLSNDSFTNYFMRASHMYANDVTPSKTLRNAEGRQFQFSLDDGIGGNLSFKTYITKKMTYYQGCMAKLDEYLNYVPPVKTIYYIRGDFNGWSDQPNYGMTMEDGIASITLTFNRNAKFKVYHQAQGLWYGTNDMSPDTTVEYTTTGNHDNIYLKPGTYKITFDPQTQLITITAA
jgi:spore coat protein CotH